MKHIFTKLFTILTFSVLALSFCQAKSSHDYSIKPQDIACTDTSSILFIGNSFTYYWDTYNMLKEIAWSQGHWVEMKTAYVGGYTFACHLADPQTLKAIEKTGEPYEYVFLQNQSSLNALYARDPKQYAPARKDAVKLAAKIRMYSPKAKLYMECTWSYPRYNYAGFGSDAEFDAYLEKGSVAFAKACKAELSPIGAAFAIVRNAHPEIALLHTDNHHQSIAGAYLKACVNYLMVFGGDFDEHVSPCGLDAGQAAILREAAIEVCKTVK